MAYGPTIYQPARSEFLLKLSFSNILNKEDVVKMVYNYRQDHIKKLDEYEEMEKYLESEGNIINTNQKFYIQKLLSLGAMKSFMKYNRGSDIENYKLYMTKNYDKIEIVPRNEKIPITLDF